uniref:Na_H_Exchanger domain-containing protein n=1 Tax=Rhabditophanes sp. KR3021 TaxID=114890 RepID=A0AC35TQA0_9BILA
MERNVSEDSEKTQTSIKDRSFYKVYKDRLLNSATFNIFLCYSFIIFFVYIFFVSLFYRDVANPYTLSADQADNSTEIFGDISITEFLKSSTLTLFMFLAITLVFGRICFYLDIPNLMGYVVFGMLIQNIPILHDNFVIHEYFIETLRLLAVVLIVGRTSLNMSYLEFKKHWFNASMVSMPPTILNCGWIIFLTHYVFGIPWEISLCYAFVIGVTAPPVALAVAGGIVSEKLGTQRGIGQIMRVSALMDNAFCIAALNIVLDYSFEPDAYHIPTTAFHLGVGIGTGLILSWYMFNFPSRSKMALFLTTRSVMFFVSAASMLFFFKTIGWYCTAAYAILLMGYICGTKYRMDEPGRKPFEQNYLDNVWNLFLEPWLFTFVGYFFKIREYNWTTIGICVIIVVSSVLVKILLTLISTSCLKLRFAEKVYLSIAFIPRGSIQVANSIMILNLSKTHSLSTIPSAGQDFYATVVIALILTTTFGQRFLRFAARKLLKAENSQSVNIEHNLSPKDGVETSTSIRF